ncbi:hypothetical protein [Pseudooceanicola nanhaiensis]|jgi:hypothetical protein|nr:hypothetical protein [Pseudooceanicola nanhaiensis]
MSSALCEGVQFVVAGAGQRDAVAERLRPAGAIPSPGTATGRQPAKLGLDQEIGLETRMRRGHTARHLRLLCDVPKISDRNQHASPPGSDPI